MTGLPGNSRTVDDFKVCYWEHSVRSPPVSSGPPLAVPVHKAHLRGSICVVDKTITYLANKINT